MQSSNRTDVELLQMKLIYAALYVSFDLIKPSQVANVDWYSRRVGKKIFNRGAVSSDDFADNLSLSSTNIASLEEQAGRFSLSKRFVPLYKLTKAFTKALGSKIPRPEALRIWRWLTRQSSDVMVLRYIRQNGESVKTMKAIALTIKMQATDIHGDRELYKGEQYYINVKPDPMYINRYEIGRVSIIGVNKQNQPIILVRSAIEIAHSSKKQALRRVSEIVCELAYMCQDENLNGSTIIFDMQGYAMRHMDRHFTAYMGDLQNLAFPGMCAKIYVWDAPKLFRTLWSAVKHFYDPTIQEIRTFTRDPKVLQETIDADQLPRELGGTAGRLPWTLPREQDDLPIKDKETRRKLLAEREALLDHFQTLTCEWLAGEPNMELREKVLEKCYTNYFTLDPYVRRRTMFDRNGVMGLCRPEFAYGGLAQPVCKVVDSSAAVSVRSSAKSARSASVSAASVSAASVSAASVSAGPGTATTAPAASSPVIPLTSTQSPRSPVRSPVVESFHLPIGGSPAIPASEHSDVSSADVETLHSGINVHKQEPMIREVEGGARVASPILGQ